MADIEAASRVLLVTQLDLPCLRNVVRLMMSFEELDGLHEKVEIVVNRAGLESGQISLKKAKETLGRDVYALLPNDYRTMVEVRNNGVPLINQAPKAAITQSLRDLAAKLQGVEELTDGEDAGKSSESKWKKFWPGAAKSKQDAALSGRKATVSPGGRECPSLFSPLGKRHEERATKGASHGAPDGTTERACYFVRTLSGRKATVSPGGRECPSLFSPWGKRHEERVTKGASVAA